MAEVVEAPATVTARATATVSSPADGTVARLRVREGQQVRAGQVLLRVESPTARRRLRQALRADAAGRLGRYVGHGARRPGRPRAQADADARARVRPGPPRGARASPTRAGPDPGAVGAAGLAVAVRRGPRQRRPGRRQLAAGLGSLSDAVAALSSAQRVQTRAAVDVARRTVAALTVRAPIAGTVSLSPPPAGTAGAGDAAGLVDQLPESLQGQAGDLLGGSGGGASVDAGARRGSPGRPPASRSSR